LSILQYSTFRLCGNYPSEFNVYSKSRMVWHSRAPKHPGNHKVANKVSLNRYCNSDASNTTVLVSSCLGFSSMEGDRSYCTPTPFVPCIRQAERVPCPSRGCLEECEGGCGSWAQVDTSTSHLAIYRSSCVEVVELKRRYQFDSPVGVFFNSTVHHRKLDPLEGDRRCPDAFAF
jgi:hypothetical protein